MTHPESGPLRIAFCDHVDLIKPKPNPDSFPPIRATWPRLPDLPSSYLLNRKNKQTMLLTGLLE